jgi:2,4-dienoyl-CoA reductase-like NADH-dependent reductase (Old Yellow Enzyme family)
MPGLFHPLAIRELTFGNRVFVSPMCRYSSENGYANDWHFVHLGSRAVGGAGLVLTEATAVLPEGRIVRFIHEPVLIPWCPDKLLDKTKRTCAS